MIRLDEQQRSGEVQRGDQERRGAVTRYGMPSENETGVGTGRAPRVVLGVAIVVAIVVRFLLLDAKPFWRDEAWVALLVDHPLRAITGGRPVPFGFLWLIRLTRVVVPGPPEISYRFAPLLAGVAIVPLLARMATTLGAMRWVAVSAAWTAVGLAPLVYYSRELKPYGIDMLLAVLVPTLAVAGFEGARGRRGPRMALLTVLLVAPWVTYAGIFPIAAMLAWSWLVQARGATSGQRRDLLLCSAAFAASFLASYLLATASQVANPRLMIYWDSRMLGHGDAPFWSRLATGVTEYVQLSTTYFFATSWKPILAVASVGAVTWPRPHRLLLLWMYAGAAVFCLAASLTDHYLIAHGRHLLFALPPLLLWTAQGLWTLARPLGSRLRPVVTVLLPIAFALQLSAESVSRRVDSHPTNITEFFRYDTLQDVDDAIAAAEPLVEPEDAVIVSLRTGYAFQFYRRGRLPQAIYCEIACPEWEDYAWQWLGEVTGSTWLILADEEVKRMRAFLAMAGLTVDERLALRGVRVWKLRPNRTAGDVP